MATIDASQRHVLASGERGGVLFGRIRRVRLRRAGAGRNRRIMRPETEVDPSGKIATPVLPNGVPTLWTFCFRNERQPKIPRHAGADTGSGNAFGCWHTSTHSAFTSSAIRIGAIRTALWIEPAAGTTSSNSRSETSQ